MPITSRDNRNVKEVRRLLTDAGYRRKTGRFAIEGARLCRDAARSGVEIEVFLYTGRAAEQYAEALAETRAAAALAEEITEELSTHMADTAAPQGLYGICRVLDNCPAFDTIKATGRLLGLEDIQDPANLGAVIRTAEALGLEGLLLSAGCCDPYNPKVLRASMGGVFRLPLYFVGEMPAAVERLRQAGRRCFASVPDREAASVCEREWRPEDVCLIGNEGSGLRHATIAACDGRVTIPMAGRAESLNAAMAAGIIMWETVRPRQTKA